jgi:hypothetical protein
MTESFVFESSNRHAIIFVLPRATGNIAHSKKAPKFIGVGRTSLAESDTKG